MSKLSKYLEAQSETVVSFAGRVGVAPSTIYRLIRGDTDCTADLARRIMTETAGAVTPNDLILPADVAEIDDAPVSMPASSAGGEGGGHRESSGENPAARSAEDGGVA